jgi:hypothetical protein
MTVFVVPLFQAMWRENAVSKKNKDQNINKDYDDTLKI